MALVNVFYGMTIISFFCGDDVLYGLVNWRIN